MSSFANSVHRSNFKIPTPTSRYFFHHIQTSSSKILINLPPTPPHTQHPGPHKTDQPQPITSPHKPNQPLIAPPITTQHLPRNRYPRQTPKADHSIQTGIIPPKHLRLTQLSHTNRRQADITPRREAEQQRKHDQLRDASTSAFRAAGQPDAKHGDHAEGYGDDHGVEASEAVGEVAGCPAPEEGADVQDREELVAEGWGDVVCEGVARYVRDGDEKGPFDHEDARGGQGEDFLLVDFQVGPEVLFDVFCRLDLRVAADQQVGENEQEEEDEGEDAGGPAESEGGEEALEH